MSPIGGNEDEALALALRGSTGWISVKDRLPETTDDVLMYTGWGSYHVGNCGCHGHNVWSSEEIYTYENGEITHWTPLPEPPKEE